MRRYLDLVQHLLAEAEPTDLNAFKAKRDAAKARSDLPDDLRYASANAKQNPSPPNSISDYLRDIVLRNLDASFGHGTWDPKDYKNLTDYLRAMNGLKMSKVYSILSEYLRKLAKETGVRYAMLSPSQRDAYLHDDPQQATYRLQKFGKGIKTETQTFPSRAALYMHVVQMIDPERAGLTDEEKTTLGSFTAEYQEHLARQKDRDPSAYNPRFPGGKPVDTWADADDEEPFDPDAVPMYNGKPDWQMIPAVEKFLKRFESTGQDDEPAYIWVSYGLSGDPIQITFNSRHEPKRVRTFPDMRALERWVLTHKGAIQRWYDVQHTQAERISDRILPKVTRSMLGLLQMVLRARETGQELSEEKIAALANKIYDAAWYIDNENIKELFHNLVFDVKRPNLREFITPYHLEWLPERIREMTAAEGKPAD